MSKQSIFYALVALSVSISLNYLSKATSKKVMNNEQGQHVLRMHKLYLVLGFISLVFAAVFLISPLFVKDADWLFYTIIFLMLLLFGGLGILSVVYFKNHYVIFDEKAFEVNSPFRGVKSLPWSKVKKVSFKPSSGLLTLVSQNDIKFRIHSHLIGFPQFVKMLEDKTTCTTRELRLPVSNE